MDSQYPSRPRRYHVYGPKYLKDVLWKSRFEGDFTTLELAIEHAKLVCLHRFAYAIDTHTGQKVYSLSAVSREGAVA